MSQSLVFRKRRSELKSRKRRPLLLSTSRGAFALREPLATGPAGEAPSLILREPEGARRAIISGAISALLHLGILGAMALAAWLAPDEVIQKIIPVEIIREQPGSLRAPVPPLRPKALRPREPRALPAQPARAVPQVAAPAPVQPSAADPIAAQAIRTQSLNPLQAPSQLRRRQVTSRQVPARDTEPSRQAAAMAPIAAVTVRPGDLKAPRVDFAGPRQIAPGAQPLPATPGTPADGSDAAPTEYQATEPDAVFASGGAIDAAAPFAIEIDTGMAADSVPGGGVVEGTGTTAGAAPCMQSTFVRDYLADVHARVYARWQLPPGTRVGEQVDLVFRLDASGAATFIEFKGEVADPALGQSAVEAMRAASPFPPMDDNVRCLAEIRLRGTFRNSAY